MVAGKIKQFFTLLKEGKSKEEAMNLAGIKKSTANRQFGIWKKKSLEVT